ncbi:hypothetical protein Sa4125_06210 [Aureimonas sp. SA4125]|nr:hypothetical protein Sa4125_06210 [Aureimonas sp. SA4125]
MPQSTFARPLRTGSHASKIGNITGSASLRRTNDETLTIKRDRDGASGGVERFGSDRLARP